MSRLLQRCVHALLAGLPCLGAALRAQETHAVAPLARISAREAGPLRTYELSSDAPLRENRPAKHRVVFSETPGQPVARTGNLLFDGLYALALHEAGLNSVSEIKDNAFEHNAPLPLKAFQTGEFWTYVWTRDLAYSTHLGLAGFDPQRAVSSLLFKTSTTKASVEGGFRHQIIQDTGSGGSYPVSTDRIVWVLGADATLQHLPAAEREAFLKQVYPILHDTIEQDRRLIFDPVDGLYRGEQSFLDWREQTYPGRTKDHVLPLALSKALSVNVLYAFALSRASGYAWLLGREEESHRYAGWAASLRTAINRGFYDPEAGLYSTYLLSEGGPAVRVHRYDLLGESLAILFDVASPEQAASILQHYPTGTFGPPVVWPQERSVPIYHNQAIWPFVTSYWLKAARKVGHIEAVERGFASLQREAAENLSNMENFDFVTGLAEVHGKGLEGPVINSRRQLWSVAAYLSMVQEIVFGLETDWKGIRFAPFITASQRREVFGGSETLELKDFNYCGARIHVRIHLPAVAPQARGVCVVARNALNGRTLDGGFVGRDALKDANEWDIFLEAPAQEAPVTPLRVVDVRDERAYFGPAEPIWDEATGGLTQKDGQVVLHFGHAETGAVTFNVFRNGRLAASGLRGSEWAERIPEDEESPVWYALEAVDVASGNASHLSAARLAGARPDLILPASAWKHQGGRLVGQQHLENWGREGDWVETDSFVAKRSGHHTLRVAFSNGSGAVNTGITCAVKAIDLVETGSGRVVATAFVLMPQSGDWKRWDLSSPVSFEFKAGERYAVRLRSDPVARNMSYLENNTRYTSYAGGGPDSYNQVNLAAIHVSD